MSPKQGTFLSGINSPADLKTLNEEELWKLCGEIREFILEVMSYNPGHLAASLGVVELTVALHYVFNAPSDKIIWDVGHQAYPHKIITGRKDLFYSNRTLGGISGFPKISESEYDAFGVGHSSTSISAALGMAVASKLNGETDRHHVAVIGDGAMTGGMALEALNNAGVTNTNLLVILNDNGIAIDKNVGALKEYLASITTSKTYNRLKDKMWRVLGGNSSYGHNSRSIMRQLSSALKASILDKSNLFEAFNFRYFGPLDGHDIPKLIKILTHLKQIQGPKLLHVVTKKGKGFSKAEKEPTFFHAPPPFDKNTGEIIERKSCEEKLPPKYQTVFGRTIIELATQNPKILGITPAMPTGCSLNLMMEKMPDRVFDVGIAEQHAVTFSAGLAASGYIPFCNIYSTFMQRAYDQVIHDVAIQKLPVIFCLDRAGLVGEDGPTHHGSFDLAYFRIIPGLIIASPMNEEELRNMMYTAQLKNNGPFVIRYPRGRGVMPDWKTEFRELPIGKGRLVSDGHKIAIISIGHTGNFVRSAIKELKDPDQLPAHYDIRFLKPIDEELLHDIFRKFQSILTVEDGALKGGLGTEITEFKNKHNYPAKVLSLGIPDQFIPHGKPEELYEICGFDSESILKTLQEMLNETN